VPDLLAGADAVIGQMRQGVPGLSELEALAAGRVVLMHLDLSLYPSDRPPVVDVASGQEIAKAIARLQENPQELARMSGAGREWVRAHHSPEAHVDALKDVYAAVMRR
jgi:glycosyltransferase involved in cell wall biosynthesis